MHPVDLAKQSLLYTVLFAYNTLDKPGQSLLSTLRVECLHVPFDGILRFSAYHASFIFL